MKLTLNVQIIIGAALGILIGIFLNIFGPTHSFYQPTIYMSEIFGGVFIDLLKMILIPLIFTSITVGIANLRAHAQVNAVWKYTLIYFTCTTAMAVILGLFAVNLFKPGIGMELALFQDQMADFSAESMTIGQFIKSFLSHLFVNPISAMATGQVLPTVLFAMFLGISLVVVGENKAQLILKFLNETYDIIMLIVGWIMALAPIGIMGLLIKVVATQNPELFGVLAKFMAVVIGATLFHGCITLPCLLFFLTGTSPLKFFNSMKEALITAFSTSSSSATLPVTITCVEQNLKVDKDVAGFVLPLGATINMDGTALYEAVAALFVANIMGIELSIGQQIIIFLTAIIAAIGAPGIPSAGMVTMIMVLQSVGLPAEAIAILLPIDRLLDAVRTTINVEGDAIGSLIVNHFVSD